MKLRSPFPTPLHLALTSGHTFVVNHEDTEVPAVFQAEALSKGAVLADGETDLTPFAITAASRAKAIESAMRAMLDSGEESEFTADGKPNLTKLKNRTGFTVSREEADAAWSVVSATELPQE